LDPFMGTGTTALAASKWGRNSVNFEIDANYFSFAAKRLEGELSSLFANPVLIMEQE
jgi:DNA modification methylase